MICFLALHPIGPYELSLRDALLIFVLFLYEDFLAFCPVCMFHIYEFLRDHDHEEFAVYC